MMMGVTPEMRRCLDAIRSLSAEGVPPTIRELRAALDIGSNSRVHALLTGLKERGHIGWRPGAPRSLYICGETPAPNPSALEQMSIADLRHYAAVVAGILAQRVGSPAAAEVFTRIAERLPASGRRAA